MTNISEYIHEIIAAIIFVMAVTLMILLNNIGADTVNIVDDDARRKNTVVEGEDISKGSDVLNGASVYYDICEYAKLGSTVQLQVKAGPGAGITSIIIPNRVKNQIRENNVSSELYNYINTEAKYYREYITDKDGNIVAVLYTKTQ